MKKVALLVIALLMLIIPSAVQGISGDPDVKKAAEYIPPISEAVPTTEPMQAKEVTPESIGAPTPDVPSGDLICWEYREGEMWAQWGTWPWSQRVTENRYWCAYWRGGPQYYRTSHVYLTSPRCSHSNAYGVRWSGGNGYTWTTVRSGGHFNCEFWNFEDWMEYACNTWGTCQFVRKGRL